jgi:DNA (cytosine-5)-methyltransferase 1
VRYISFCSGIEAATAAWHPLGWSPVAFCEIDRFPSKVLAHHYPDVPNLGDFTKVDWSQYSADICVGGTPCQAFSVAGLRNSLADERGNLTLEFVRAINTIRPHTVVWENVPGVLSTADNAFGCFLAALVGCDEPIVFEQGWPNAGVVDGPDRRAAWRVLDAQYVGLAQRRKRVFVVANSGDRPHPAEILLEWESLRRDSPPSREKGEGVAHPVAPSLTSSGQGVERGGDTRGQDPVVAMCLNAKGGGGRIDAESETFVTHSLRADGFDASEDGTGRGTPLVPVAWDEELNAHEDISGSIIRGGDGGRHAGVMAFSRKDHGADAGELAPTLRIMTHDGSHANGGGQVAVAIQAGALRENPASGPDGVGVQEHIAYTLEARAEVQATQTGMAVRRLLPEECEALQGFRRGYTKIPGAADGPRYKALGNSFAVPVVAWIGKRITEAYGKH